MLVQSHTFRPMFKTYSPMSSGAWVLLLFSVFAFVSFAGVIAERGWPGGRSCATPARTPGSGGS